jgi:hypothetical protein
MTAAVGKKGAKKKECRRKCEWIDQRLEGRTYTYVKLYGGVPGFYEWAPWTLFEWVGHHVVGEKGKGYVVEDYGEEEGFEMVIHGKVWEIDIGKVVDRSDGAQDDDLQMEDGEGAFCGGVEGREEEAEKEVRLRAQQRGEEGERARKRQRYIADYDAKQRTLEDDLSGYARSGGHEYKTMEQPKPEPFYERVNVTTLTAMLKDQRDGFKEIVDSFLAVDKIRAGQGPTAIATSTATTTPADLALANDLASLRTGLANLTTATNSDVWTPDRCIDLVKAANGKSL